MDAEASLNISWEWESAPGVRLPEHQATWARVEIRAGEDFVTLVEDRESGSSRRSIYVPLYPLAEWMAFNWWKLLFNSRLSRPELIARFERTRLTDPELLRNNFRRIGDGFSWPDLAIVPAGSQTVISWRPYMSPVANWRIRYIGRGDVTTTSAEIQGEFSRIINAVIARLDESGITATALHKEWAAVTGADAEEAEYCRTAARFGLDPYSEAYEFEDEIIRSSQAIPPDLFADFVDAVTPTRIYDSQRWVSQAAAELEGSTSHWGKSAEEIRAALTGFEAVSKTRPWESGWEQAKLARQVVQVSAIERFTVSDYVSTKDLASPEPRIQALGRRRRGDEAALVIGSRQTSAKTRNFLFGRALWHSVASN